MLYNYNINDKYRDAFSLGNLWQKYVVSDAKKMANESALRDAEAARKQQEAMIEFMSNKAISSGSQNSNNKTYFIVGGVMLFGLLATFIITRN